MIGRLLDHRYQVIRVLATGGFGQTYIAQDTKRPGNPICVVKHLKPASSDPRVFETAKRLFHSEAEALENLGNHGQIPRLLAYFDENQEFFLVQEFIEGRTLGDELLPGKCWSENQVIQLLQEILGILEFVHSQGVIHRDIKPDNIIRRTADNKLVLVDFGAVKQLRNPIATVGVQTTATVVIGTPGYMSTEQGQGKPRPNSDIYALGIIAIQALTGVAAAQLQEDPETGEIIWQHLVPVNPRLAAVLTKMVRYHFKDRYQSATEALQAVTEVFNPVSVLSTPQKSRNKSTYPAIPHSPGTRQETIAFAPANPVSAKPARPDSHKPDPLPLFVGLLLAGGAAALVANVYPNVRNLAANFTGENLVTENQCLAIVAGNSNIRSEPSSINSDTIVQTVAEETKFAVTGRQTKRGWIEIKRNSRSLAWAHTDVITNNAQRLSCLKEKGIAIKTLDDSTLIASRPQPKVTPKAVKTGNRTPKASDPFISQPFVSTPGKSDKNQPVANREDILARAKQKYESGDLPGAIALLKTIPENATAGFQETAAMINQWQEDWAKADALFNEINTAIDNGEWDKVLAYKDNPEKLPNIKYWQKRLEPLFKKATENLIKQGLPQLGSQDNQNNSPKARPNNTDEPDAKLTPAENL
jgi:serine/threonine protein kinase, bacterial